MTTFITIVFSVMVFICFCGILAEKDPGSRKCITVCFGICAALILAVNIIGGAL